MVRDNQLVNIRQAFEALLSLESKESDETLVTAASGSAHRPTFLFLHPGCGLIAVEAARPGESENSVRMRLNDKVIRLKNEAACVDKIEVTQISVTGDPESLVRKIGVHAWICSISGLAEIKVGDFRLNSRLDSKVFKQLRDLLLPPLAVDIPVYGGVLDVDRESRQMRRIELDAVQSDIAASDIEDVLIVEGGPGTGKTLVLIGRAKWLAQLHPDWKILVVVYNNILLEYFRSIPDIPDSVRIVTLKRFLEVRGEQKLAKLLNDFDNPERAESEASRLVDDRVFMEDDIDIDALLVDEWQDFKKPFVKYLLQVLRPNRGGAVFVGDAKQALYTDGFSSPFHGRKVKRLTLKRPYRSTKQILQLASALDPEYGISGIEEALDGEPVTAIYAKHWPLQGQVIAIEIQDLLKKGTYRRGEIAVVCTTRQGAKHVENALLELSINCQLMTRYWEEHDLNADAVKVMTVHGAKGIGFSVVFLQGFETLKDNDGTLETAKWRRVGFVGATRAQDLLYIVYRDITQFVTSILDLGSTEDGTVRTRLFPEDYRKMLSR